jgi:hypothetical protein
MDPEPTLHIRSETYLKSGPVVKKLNIEDNPKSTVYVLKIYLGGGGANRHTIVTNFFIAGIFVRSNKSDDLPCDTCL